MKLQSRTISLALFLAGGLLLCSCGPRTERPGDTNVVAVINGRAVSADLFQHEFRSTFFQHLSFTGDVRQAVFDPFLKRMLVVEKARELGLADRPEIRTNIARRLADMKAFMDYQLAMAEAGMLTEALVKELGIEVAPDEVSNADLQAFYEREIRPRPGAPSTLAGVPPALLEGMRQQAAQRMVEAKLSELIQAWSTNMTIEIHTNVVMSVPLPDMEGDVPERFRQGPR